MILGLLFASDPCTNFAGISYDKLLASVLQVGVLIGKAGDTIRYLQYNSGAKIQIMRDAEADPNRLTRPVEIIGTSENIKKAEELINAVIAEVYFFSIFFVFLPLSLHLFPLLLFF